MALTGPVGVMVAAIRGVSISVRSHLKAVPLIFGPVPAIDTT